MSFTNQFDRRQGISLITQGPQNLLHLGIEFQNHGLGSIASLIHRDNIHLRYICIF